MSTRPEQWVSLLDRTSRRHGHARGPHVPVGRGQWHAHTAHWPDLRAADHVVRGTCVVAEATGPLNLVLTDFSRKEGGTSWALSSFSPFPGPGLSSSAPQGVGLFCSWVLLRNRSEV